MNPKITEQHRSRPAYIYVRQSTNAQVLHHQEGTERLYALRAMALELGWSESAIRTLDRDLGMTGTEMTRREDFKTLVADGFIAGEQVSPGAPWQIRSAGDQRERGPPNR